MADVIEPTVRRDNPDRAFLHELLSAQARDVTLDMNPALASLRATLLAGSAEALSIRFTAPAHSVQGNRVVSGGTLASMLDLAMALALLAKLPHGRTCATISLTVDMIEPGYVGDFIADARVKRLGGRVSFVEADLTMRRERDASQAPLRRLRSSMCAA